MIPSSASRASMASGRACCLLVLTATAVTGMVNKSPADAQTTQRLLPGQLYAVDSAGASNAWAVGVSRGRTLTERWDGHVWTRILSPNAPARYDSSLVSVSIVSSDDAWAVGNAQSATTQRALAIHWDGHRWNKTPLPIVAGETFKSLNAVSAISATNVWAVGDYSTVNEHRTLILHWNGDRWIKVKSPSPFPVVGAHLTGVAAAGAANAWSVGYYTDADQVNRTLIVHWTGYRWVRVVDDPPGPMKTGILTSVSAAATEVWAVGAVTTRNQRPFTERWRNGAWHTVRSVNPDAYLVDLYGVASREAGDAWAVGTAYKKGNNQTFIEHWNGDRWHRVASPSPGPQVSLNGIVDNSERDAWCVGSSGTYRALVPMILHWDGRRWHRYQP